MIETLLYGLMSIHVRCNITMWCIVLQPCFCNTNVVCTQYLVIMFLVCYVYNYTFYII